MARSDSAPAHVSAPRNRVLAQLAPSDFAALRPHLTRVQLDRGTVLCEVGDTLDSLCFPDDALLSFVSPMPTGDAVETFMVGCDGGVGCLEAAGTRLASARVVVQIPGRAWKLSATRYRELIDRSFTLRAAFIGRIEVQVAEMRQAYACRAIHPVEKRMCNWLLQAQDRTGLDSLPVTQDFIAGVLAVQRTSVTAAAGKLQARNLIRYGRGSIEIIDRAAVERCACDCYDLLRDIQAQIERRILEATRPSRTPASDHAAET